MLPHTRPGGMAGLLEILQDQGGRADLHRLADELSLAVDDLLPTVETASLLGLLKVEEGDAIITDRGRRIRKADIQERKAIFRKAVLENVPLLRQMEQALRTKSDGTLPRRILSGSARRALQRRRIAAAAGNRHSVGPLRRTF